jgi:hypothetical protein
MIKPTPAERAAVIQSGTPLNREVLKIRLRLTGLLRKMERSINAIDTLIASSGGLSNVQTDLGVDSSDFDTAYDSIVAAIQAIDTAAAPPARTRDRAADIAANKRAGIP